MMAKGFVLALSAAAVLATSCAPDQTGFRRMGYQVYETSLVVDAKPLSAEVLIDGRSLGPAEGLIARVLSVTPGMHIIEVRAPGYSGYVGTFTADSRSTVNRFWIVLPPDLR